MSVADIKSRPLRRAALVVSVPVIVVWIVAAATLDGVTIAWRECASFLRGVRVVWSI